MLHTIQKKLVTIVFLSLFAVSSISLLPEIANAQAAASTDPVGKTACSSENSYQTLGGWGPELPSFQCMITFVTVNVGSLLIYLVSFLVSFADKLFNNVILYTIVNFGSFYELIRDSVETVWTAFRDLSNIVIIGVFVYIGISIILEIKDYGSKKLILYVIFGAILINFSLLFTKMMVDVSNYTALQFYNASVQKSSGTSQGIGDRFLTNMGVNGLGDSSQMLTKIANETDSSWAPLIHSIVVAVLLIMTAVVLFYGTFILIARAVLIVFLLLTSALAFATWIFPQGVIRKNGWDTWLQSLIHTTLLAPLLMVFLWAVLIVSKSLKNNDSLGAAIDNIGGIGTGVLGANSVNGLFGYFIILGLLYAAMATASSFSKKASYFDYARIPGALAAAAGLRVGERVGGWGGSRIHSILDAASRKTMTKADSTSGLRRMFFTAGAQMMKGVSKAGSAAAEGKATAGLRAALKSDLAPLTKNKIGSAIAGSALGVDGGYAGARAAAEESLKRQGKELALTDDQRKAMIDDARKVREQALAQDPQLKSDHDKAATEKSVADSAHEAAKSAETRSQKDFEEKVSSLTRELTKAQAAQAVGKEKGEATPEADKRAQEIGAKIERAQSERKAEMRIAGENITQARLRAEEASGKFAEVQQVIADRARELNPKIDQKLAQELEEGKHTALDISATLARNQGTWAAAGAAIATAGVAPLLVGAAGAAATLGAVGAGGGFGAVTAYYGTRDEKLAKKFDNSDFRTALKEKAQKDEVLTMFTKLAEKVRDENKPKK